MSPFVVPPRLEHCSATRHRVCYRTSQSPAAAVYQQALANNCTSPSSPVTTLPVQTQCKHWVSAAAEQEQESLPGLAQRDIAVTAPHTLLWAVHYSAADTAAATASPLVTAAARSVLSRASSSRMHWTLSRSTASCSLCSEKRRSSSEASLCRMAAVSA